MPDYAASSEAFELVDGHILRARCKNCEGEWVESEIDLDTILGNNNGTFEWGGENWSHTARGVNLELGWRLTADLENADGEYGDRAVIDLNEKIGNEDGKLVYDG